MKFNNYIFWRNLSNIGISIFLPMTILGLLLGNITTPKFLILGWHPVKLLGCLASLGLGLSSIVKIIIDNSMSKKR